jgi:hypothetical protein
MITVYTFQFPSEAYPLKALLESSGIPVVLSNENLISINPLLSNMLGGVAVQVSEQDEKEARRICDLFFKDPPHNTTDIEPKWKLEYDEVQTWCPSCDHFPVFQKKASAEKSIVIGLIVSLFSFLLFWFIPKKLVCAHCGHEWTR